MKKLFLILTIFSSALIGCDSGSGGGSGSKKMVLVNGKAPTDYYKPFMHDLVTCEGDDNYTYSAIPLANAGKTEDGQKIKAAMEFFINKDKSFHAEYTEFVEAENGTYAEVGSENIHGTWSIKGTDLHLNGLGYATALNFNDEDVMVITFDQPEKFGIGVVAIVYAGHTSRATAENHYRWCPN